MSPKIFTLGANFRVNVTPVGFLCMSEKKKFGLQMSYAHKVLNFLHSDLISSTSLSEAQMLRNC